MSTPAQTPGALTRTPVRTSHGKVTLVLYMRPTPCGGDCLFCFSVNGVTKSTTANEDTLLAASCDWSPAGQLEARFNAYGLTRGTGLKCDLAVKGDSFCRHDDQYLREYFKSAYDFLNGCASESLEEAIALQVDSPDRCVSVKVETRPDHVTDEACRLMIELGVTTVELGVQSLDDALLGRINRGHGVATVTRATALLRAYGFEVGYQVMVGLPGGSYEGDRKLLSESLWRPEHSPDALKIYPCLMLDARVASQPGLARALREGWWRPMTSERYARLLAECYPVMPRWVHINGIQRIMASADIAEGPREPIDRRSFADISQCLWQRSVARSSWSLDADFSGYSLLTTGQGPASYCVEALMRDNTVIGYGRLSVSGGTGVIRDLRVLGEMRRVAEGSHGRLGCQHVGVGTAMLAEMDRTASAVGATHLAAHVSPGARQWLASRGFAPDGPNWLRRPVSPSLAGASGLV